MPALGEFATAWDELASQPEFACLGLRSYVLEAWADESSRFVLVLDHGELVGGLPVQQRRRFRHPHVSGSRPGFVAGIGAYFDIVHRQEASAAVAEQIQGWFDRQGLCTFSFDGLLEDAELIGALRGPHRVAPQVGVPWIELGGDFDAYLATRSANFRKNLRRVARRYGESNDVQYRQVALSEMEASVADFSRLHEAQFPGSYGPHRDLDRFREMIVAGATRGEMGVDGLWSADGPAVALVTYFQMNGVLRGLEIARDQDREWDDAGTYLLLRLLQSAFERGLKAFDFGPGDHVYKSRFANSRHQLVTVEGARPRWASGLVLSSQDWVGRARSRVVGSRSARGDGRGSDGGAESTHGSEVD